MCSGASMLSLRSVIARTMMLGARISVSKPLQLSATARSTMLGGPEGALNSKRRTFGRPSVGGRVTVEVVAGRVGAERMIGAVLDTAGISAYPLCLN